ncbi:MAG: SdrD B-like domain-containing protein [Burkholderiaceae bacterium]
MLPAGEKIVCTISGTPTVTVAIKAKVVTGADGDTVSTNNDGVLVSTVAALSVAKTVSANPLIIGAANQYYSISIAVTNGPTIELITLTDNFSTGITTSGPVTISGGIFKPGTCPAANAAGATSLSGCQIEAGVTGTVYINVPILVDESAEGPTGGNNIVTASGGGDPACPTSASCIGTTGSVAVIYGDLGALFIRKVADRTTAEVGDVITYKVTVRSTKIKGAATVEDHLPLGFRLISNTTRVSKGGVLTAAADPTGAPGPNLAFNIQIPAFDQDVEIEYKVRVGLGADRGDGINSAQASMVRGRLRSLIAKAKVKITGGVFTREACIVGKVYADCNGNALQDKGERGLPGVTLYLEDGTSMTTDENGQYSICGVRAVTHVLKVDSKTLPKGAKLGITGNRNAGDPNTLFVDVLAGQLHNTEFRIDSCSPQPELSTDVRQKPVSRSGAVQFDSGQPKILGSGAAQQPNTKVLDAGSKQ